MKSYASVDQNPIYASSSKRNGISFPVCCLACVFKTCLLRSHKRDCRREIHDHISSPNNAPKWP